MSHKLHDIKRFKYNLKNLLIKTLYDEGQRFIIDLHKTDFIFLGDI